jgi:hypothetical protein
VVVVQVSLDRNAHDGAALFGDFYTGNQKEQQRNSEGAGSFVAPRIATTARRTGEFLFPPGIPDRRVVS